MSATERPHDNPEHWLELAHRSRETAASFVDNKEAAEALIGLAESYERIAAALEQMAAKEREWRDLHQSLSSSHIF